MASSPAIVRRRWLDGSGCGCRDGGKSMIMNVEGGLKEGLQDQLGPDNSQWIQGVINSDRPSEKAVME